MRRKDYRLKIQKLNLAQHKKQSKRHLNKKHIAEFSISVLGIAAVIGIGCIIFHQHKIQQAEAARQVLIKKRKHERQYCKTHFNPNITIDNVSVGSLTKKQAYKKINSSALNSVYLHDDKIYWKHDKTVTTVSHKKLNEYFAKQHTTYISNKKNTFTEPFLIKQKSALANIAHNKTSFKLANVTYTVNNNIFDKISVKVKPKLKLNQMQNTMQQNNQVNSQTDINNSNNTTQAPQKNNATLSDIKSDAKLQYKFSGKKRLVAFIDSLNKKYATLHKSYWFKAPTHKQVKVTNESYGWKLDQKKVIKKIEKSLIKGKKKMNIADCLSGIGFNPNGTGFKNNGINHGIGKNYVYVSIPEQKLWIVKNNKIKIMTDKIVTGDKSKHQMTSEGVWYVGYKQSPAILRGKNDDGSDYASPVQYWMPFTEDGQGLHDSPWRSATEYNSREYITDGSHGCVNIRPDIAQKVWNLVETGMPVIISYK